MKVLVLLKDKEVGEHAKTEPTRENLNSATWKKSNAKARNLIVRCIANLHLDYVKDKSTAYEMINSLCAIFERKSSLEQKYISKRNLCI